MFRQKMEQKSIKYNIKKMDTREQRRIERI